MKVDQVPDKCNTRGECLWSLWVLVIAWRDACFRGYVTSKSVNNLHEYTFQFFCYVYLNLSTQKDINFFDQGISTNRRGLVVCQRDRYAGATGKRWFKSRRLPRKKKEKGNRGALERVIGEWEGKKGKERGGKYKKRQKLKSFFTNAVSIDYRCIYAILWGIHHCLRRQ